MWTMTEHLINATMWATIGNYWAIPYLSQQDSVPMPVGLAVISFVYSYATDMISSSTSMSA